MIDLDRPQHGQRPSRPSIQILADRVLEQGDVDDVFLLRDADAGAEVANGFRRVPAPPDAGDRRHPRIVPSRDELLLDQREQLALAHHRVIQIEPREFDLPRPRPERGVLADAVHHPVVERTMILELERAQRVRDALDRIRDRVRVVVGRIDAPGVARPMMRRVPDPVQRRIPHVDVRRRHVDRGAQHMGAIGKLAGAHAPKQVEALRRRPAAMRAVPARLRQGPAIVANLVGGEAVHIGVAVANELLGKRVHLLEIVRGVVHPLCPVEAEPAHVLLDRVDVLGVFLRRIRVVEAEVADPAELLGDAEVETDGLRVADVQIAVGLGRETRMGPAVAAGCQIAGDDFTDEVEWPSRLWGHWQRIGHQGNIDSTWNRARSRTGATGPSRPRLPRTQRGPRPGVP